MNLVANSVCCPVCTLYMREGITLQNHLNTHPKEQVIEALVRFTTGNVSAATVKEQGNVSTDDHLLHVNNVNQGVEVANTAPQYSNAGGSHFTAAITYQQFLSSNSTSSSPQYVSLPTVVTPADAGSHGQANQALMPFVYNPYVIPQQQQQLSFLNTVNHQSLQQPLVRQIPVMNQGIYPVPPQPTPSPLSSVSHYIQHTVQHIPNDQANQTNRIPFVQSQNEKPIQIEFPAECISGKEEEIETPSGIQNNYVGKTPTELNKLNSPNDHQTVDTIHAVSSGSNQYTTSNVLHNLITPSSYSAENNSDKILRNLDREPRSCDTDDVDHDDDGGSSNEENDHYREFLLGKKVAGMGIAEVRPRSESKSPPQADEDAGIVLGSRGLVNNSDPTIKDICPAFISAGCSGCNRDIKINHVLPQHEKAILQDNSSTMCGGDSSDVLPLKNVIIVEDEIQYDTGSKSIVLEMDCSSVGETINLELLGTVAVSNANSVISPSVATNEQDGEDTLAQKSASLNEPGVQLEDKEMKQENEISHNVDLNIQADEMMPPRGELSEQESLGGNDSSTWVQNYQDADDVSTSYDLLARESWDASDGSDSEMSGQLHISTAVKSKSPVVVSKKGKMKKLYKCLSCNEIFNCPKERRVHYRTLHKDSADVSKNKPCKVEDTFATLKTEAENDTADVEDKLKPVHSLEERLTDIKITDIGSSNNLASGKNNKDKVNTSNIISADFKSDKDCEIKEETFSFKCVALRCPLSFPSEEHLNDHIDTVHRERSKRGAHICSTCHETFPSEILYRAHLKEHPLECSHCGKFFSRHQNLNLHMKRHLGIKPFKCAICDKAFVTKQKLTEHTNVHTGAAPIKCGLCGETFRRYSNLIQHKNRHHLKVKKKMKDFFCHCGEVFHSKKKLEWHKEFHDEKPKACPFCSVKFVHSVSLTRHIRRSHDRRYVPHKGREAENVHCPICNSVFLRGSMAAHMRLHTGERPYQCNICTRRFTTKWNLQLHRWTHAARSAKPYKCELCKAAFYRHSAYTAHVRSHRGTKPYTCNYCGQPFVYKYNCLRHVREHEVSKSYSCAVCGKMFHRGYYLKEHMTVHSGSRPYTCHICGKGSSTKSNHNKHVKIHHAREPVNSEG